MIKKDYFIFLDFSGNEYARITRTLKGAKSYFYKLSNKNIYKLKILDNNFNFKKSVVGYYNIVEYLKSGGLIC